MTYSVEHVVVTGGTGALGQAVCTAFVRAGAQVTATYIDAAELARLPAELQKSEQFTTAKVDLVDESAVTAFFERFERLDVLVCVAGGFAMGDLTGLSLAEWRRMHDLNLTTCFLASREGLKRMDRDRGGRIVHVGAFAAENRVGGMSAYTTSKAAVLNLTRSLAEETLRSNITVNAVLPTIMDTPGNRAGMPDADFDDWVPLETVAATIDFLASAAACPITGALIPLRGRCP